MGETSIPLSHRAPATRSSSGHDRGGPSTPPPTASRCCARKRTVQPKPTSPRSRPATWALSPVRLFGGTHRAGRSPAPSCATGHRSELTHHMPRGGPARFLERIHNIKRRSLILFTIAVTLPAALASVLRSRRVRRSRAGVG
jgi:hypothetical protein